MLKKTEGLIVFTYFVIVNLIFFCLFNCNYSKMYVAFCETINLIKYVFYILNVDSSLIFSFFVASIEKYAN